MTTMMLPTTTAATSSALHNHPPPENDAALSDDLSSALDTLGKFASIDTMEYASLLVAANSSEAQQRQQQRRNDKSTARSSIKHGDLMLQLEALRKNRNFVETPIPDLVQAIHRFHSNLALWHHQDAQHAQEMRDLQAALTACQHREQTLMKECKSLKKQNVKLKSKLKEKRSVMAKVRTWYKASVAERESLQEIATAAQLQVHEHVMASPGRIRLGSTETTDSNFSDVDALNFLESDYVATNTNTKCADGDYTHTEKTAEGSESQSSLVTDEGVATLQFTPDESLPRIAATSSTYTLDFNSGMKTGMRVKAVPLADWAPSSKPALSPVHLEGQVNGFALPLINHDQEEELHDTTTEGFAFVVCGHHETSSEKAFPRAALPPIGARILAVRDQKVLPTWDISAVLAAMMNTADGKPTFTVTFRNGRISKALAGSDDESQEEAKCNESTADKSQQRPFALLKFGKNTSNKTKDVEKKEHDEKEQAKPAPQKGNSNPLMFWRNEDKANVSVQTKPDDLSSEESAQYEPKEETPTPDQEAEGEADDKTEPSADSSLELKESKETKESGLSRARKNTADSFANTEATAMSKEDASVASCSEQNTAEADEPTTESVKPQNKPTPVNHLMFWRKHAELPPQVADTTEPTVQESNEPPKEKTEVEKTEPNENDEKVVPSESSGFRMPFWGARPRHNQTTSKSDEQEASATEDEVAAASGGSEEKNDSEDVAEPFQQEEDPSKAKATDESSVDDAQPIASDDDLTPDTREAPNAAEDTTVAKEGDYVKEETPCAQAPEAPQTDTPSETLEAESATEQPPNKDVDVQPSVASEQDGPIKHMSRFFPNPFAK